MDDQSSITLMSLHAVQKMRLPLDALRNDSLATVTVQGTSTDEPCKVATGLNILPLHAPKRKIQLPSTFIQREIPSASREVPTRDEVAQLPGFEHLAPYFHYPDKGWSTILLVGRDCIEAQRQRSKYHWCLKQTTRHSNQTVPLRITELGTPLKPCKRNFQMYSEVAWINSRKTSIWHIPDLCRHPDGS